MLRAEGVNVLKGNGAGSLLPVLDVLEGVGKVELDDLAVVVLGVQVSEVGGDQVNEPADVLDSDCLVLLLKIVDVAVEDLDKELDVEARLHARVGDLEGLLEALEHPPAVLG